MLSRIFLVDNNLYSRSILRDILVTHGFSVCGECSSGVKALECYEQAHPDVYIIAATIQDIDGVSIIRALKQKNPQITTILSASAGQRSTVMEALSAGAVDFIARPYTARRVVAILKKHCI